MHDKRFDPKQIEKLEDPQRLTWLPPSEIVGALALEPGMTIADLGAGSGYFAIPIARAVGDSGKVFAVDVSPEMLGHLREKLAQPGMPSNIDLVEGEATGTTLPTASCDVVFFANVWHEIEDHLQALRESERLLRPLGRIAILDWSPEATRPPGPPLEHRIARSELEKMASDNGWKVQRAENIGQYTYLVIAQPPPPSA
jgi:ubiquinone/menaquinone biosynthesis C-methylase UbiE